MERCRVCGKPETHNIWFGSFFSYCSFNCQAYAWRYVSLPLIVVCFIWIIAKINIVPLLGLTVLVLYAIIGFTTDIEPWNEEKITFENVKYNYKRNSITCLHCGFNLTTDDKFCQYCGKSTDEELLAYYSKKFNQVKLYK